MLQDSSPRGTDRIQLAADRPRSGHPFGTARKILAGRRLESGWPLFDGVLTRRDHTGPYEAATRSAVGPSCMASVIETSPVVTQHSRSTSGVGYRRAVARVAIHGPDIAPAARVVTNLALLVHEFATNAVKYGALPTPNGNVDVASSLEGDQYSVVWTERGGPAVGKRGSSRQATVSGQLDGVIHGDWNPTGATICLRIPREASLARHPSIKSRDFRVPDIYSAPHSS